MVATDLVAKLKAAELANRRDQQRPHGVGRAYMGHVGLLASLFGLEDSLGQSASHPRPDEWLGSRAPLAWDFQANEDVEAAVWPAAAPLGVLAAGLPRLSAPPPAAPSLAFEEPPRVVVAPLAQRLVQPFAGIG